MKSCEDGPRYPSFWLIISTAFGGGDFIGFHLAAPFNQSFPVLKDRCPLLSLRTAKGLSIHRASSAELETRFDLSIHTFTWQ